MAETIQNIKEKQDIVFRNLLVDLNGRLNIPSLLLPFKTKMKTYLSESELSTEEFLIICEALERGGHIAPKKLQILKDATQNFEATAHDMIVVAEKEIYRLQKDTLAMKVRTYNVEPSNQKQKLLDAVYTFFTEQVEIISQEKDFGTRKKEMKGVIEDLGIFEEILQKTGVTPDHVEYGCLMFVFRYNSQNALKRLWALYTSGELLVMLKNGIFTTSILERYHVTSLDLDVYISEEEYEYCLKNAEMLESDVMGDFEVPLEVSRNASQASEKKRHSDLEHTQETAIPKEATNQDIKDLDGKVMSSTDIMSSFRRPQPAVRARGSNRCPHHQGMEVLFVCKDCNGDLICAKCLETIHNKHTVEAVYDVIPQVKVTIQDFINKTENTRLPEFYEQIKSVKEESFRNESHYTNVIAKIEKQNENLKLNLDKTANKVISMCRECEKQNDDILKNHKAELQSKIEKLNARVKELKDTLQTGTDTQIYETSKDIPNEVTIPALPSLQDMDFNPTSVLIDQLERSFGHREKIHKADDQQMPSGDTDNITDEDKDLRVALGISTYKQEEDVVVEYKLFKTFTYQRDIFRINAISNVNQVCVAESDTTLALLTNTGQVQRTMKIDACIQDFCVSPLTGDIWFCSRDDNSVRKVTGDNKSTVMFHTDSEPLSICISADGNILVGLGRQIVKYTQRGHILCKSTQVNQVPVVRYPLSISPCPITRNIAVVDWDRKDWGGDDKAHVSLLSEDLQLLCRYYGRDIERFDPWDVCYSDTGDIYIADCYNRSIQQINGTGQFRQTVYTDRDKPAVYVCIQSNGDIWAVFSLASVVILQKQ